MTTQASRLSADLATKIKSIRGVTLDVDGVLTDGTIILDAAGREFKIFHVHDGLGLLQLQRLGLTIAIVSGRESEAVSRRAQELNIDLVYQNVQDKTGVLCEIIQKTGITEREFAHIGDDLGDLAMFSQVGVAVAVANAVDVVKQRADYVTQRSGGLGAVREFCDLVQEIQTR